MSNVKCQECDHAIPVSSTVSRVSWWRFSGLHYDTTTKISTSHCWHARTTAKNIPERQRRKLSHPNNQERTIRKLRMYASALWDLANPRKAYLTPRLPRKLSHPNNQEHTLSCYHPANILEVVMVLRCDATMHGLALVLVVTVV
jgi:hypothetical protein